MNKRRLLKLAALLDVVPADKFYMGSWAITSAPIGKEPTCATKACALGWATTIPEFKKLGLRLVADPGDMGGYVLLGKSTGSDAAAELFDISYWHCVDLFESGCDDAPGKAREIRALVAAG